MGAPIPTTSLTARPPSFPCSQVKDRVYKQRIRIQDFFGDFDRLRCGSITPTQFARALGLAGFTMTEAQYSELSDAYPSAVADRPVCYKDFCADVNGVFTKYHLEKAPLEHVEPKPASLLDTERFSAKPTRSLGTEDDERVDQILDAIAEGVRKRRVEVKPFFNDACSNQNSPMRVNHVTKQQFKQVVRAHVARELGDEEMSAVADRFGDDDGFVNFVSFSACVDPKEELYHPYRRSLQ